MGKKHQNYTPQRNSSSQKTQKGKLRANNSKRFKKKPSQSYSSKNTKFMPCNSTNIQIIKTYFQTICPQLFDRIARKGDFQLFQFEEFSYEIFLVPVRLSRFVKKMTKTLPIHHAGIHLGYMRSKRAYTGFERAFYLSYEGGEYLYNLIHNKFPDLKESIQTIKLDKYGEKSFLYGQNIDFTHVLSDTQQLMKKQIIFVLNKDERYIGLSLLLVKQAGAVHAEAKDSKFQTEFSKSPNFTLALINLTDAGYFLRKGK